MFRLLRINRKAEAFSHVLTVGDLYCVPCGVLGRYYFGCMIQRACVSRARRFFVIYVTVFSNKRVTVKKKLWLITAKQCPDKQQVGAAGKSPTG